MKIVMVCEFYDERLEYQENLLAEVYTRNGHQVTVITSTIASVFDYVHDRDKGKGKISVQEVPGRKIIRMPFRVNFLNRIKAFPSLRPIFEAEKPDLIFFHDIIPNIIEGAAYVRRHPPCRLIMDYHADYTNSGKNWLSLKILHGVIRRWFLDRARPQISRIFPVVPASGEFLRDIYGVRDDEMELLPLGTDLQFGRKVRASGAGAQLRKELGFPSDAFVVFTGGKFTKLKKTDQLVDAVRMIDDPRLRLLVIGAPAPGEEEYAANLYARAEGDPRILFRGWQDRQSVYAHMDAADVAVFPSSQSVLWQQSIGMGLPIMLSERSDLLPTAQDVQYLNLHDNLILLDHERPLGAEIARHLRELLADPECVARMSLGADRTASEMLDWDRLMERTLRFNRQDADEGRVEASTIGGE